jgi:hypothetical protein
VAKLKSAVYSAVAGAYIKIFKYGFSVFLAFGMSALVITLFVREHRLRLPVSCTLATGKIGRSICMSA